MNDLDAIEASDPEFSQVIMNSELSPENMTEHQMWRFSRMAQARLGQLEFAYLALNEGTIGDYHWGAVEGYIQHMICLPGYRAFWVANGETIYHPDFVELVSNMLPHCGN